MAIPHAEAAQVIDVRPLGTELKTARTTTLARTDSFEMIRLVLPKGKEMQRHQVSGEITVQCLEGHVTFHAGETKCELTAGNLIYLAGSAEHSLRAVEDSSLLLMILFEHKTS